MIGRWQCRVGIAGVCLAVALFATVPASAQHGGGGHGGGGHGGGSWGGHGGYGYGHYHGGWGYGHYPGGWGFGLYLDLGYPYYGWGYGYPYYGYDDWYGYPPDGAYPPLASAPAMPNYSAAPGAGYAAAPPLAPNDPRTAQVRVLLPEPSAEVWFNEGKTRQQGADRTFATVPIDSDQGYQYTIEARWTDAGGTQRVAHQALTLHPGDRLTVDFRQGAATGAVAGERRATGSRPSEPQP
jgi:uncharacterized protein (TIGR03000 family)